MIRVAVNNTDFNITSPFLNDSNTNVVTDHSGALIAGITVVCVLVLLGLGYSKFSQSIMFRNTVRAVENIPIEPVRFNHDNVDNGTTLSTVLDNLYKYRLTFFTKDSTVIKFGSTPTCLTPSIEGKIP